MSQNISESIGILKCISFFCYLSQTFGGFLLNVVFAWWLGWCRYLSIFWYALSAMSIIELRGVHFCPKTLNSTTEREALSGPFAGSNLTKSTSWLVF